MSNGKCQGVWIPTLSKLKLYHMSYLVKSLLITLPLGNTSSPTVPTHEKPIVLEVSSSASLHQMIQQLLRQQIFFLLLKRGNREIGGTIHLPDKMKNFKGRKKFLDGSTNKICKEGCQTNTLPWRQCSMRLPLFSC